MAIITISRQMGSLGMEIAQAVANRLNYQYVDKEKIGRALADCGLPKIEIEKLDEKNPPFWDSWLIDRKKFFRYIQRVIIDFAQKNNVVILGRGGQIILQGVPGVLKVRIIAPLDVRIRRIKEQDGVDEMQAVRRLKRNDQDSGGFIRSFFNVNWEDSSLYDLVINTQKLSVDTGMKLILESIQFSEIKEAEKRGEEKLADLVLFQKVESTLGRLAGMDSKDINIHVEEGVVTLEGTITSGAEKETCERAVAGIKGVKRVNNQLTVGQYYRQSA